MSHHIPVNGFSRCISKLSVTTHFIFFLIIFTMGTRTHKLGCLGNAIRLFLISHSCERHFYLYVKGVGNYPLTVLFCYYLSHIYTRWTRLLLSFFRVSSSAYSYSFWVKISRNPIVRVSPFLITREFIAKEPLY